MEKLIYSTYEEKIEKEFFDFYAENTNQLQTTLNDAVMKIIQSSLGLNFIDDALQEFVDFFVDEQCIDLEFDGLVNMSDVKFNLLGLLKEMVSANIKIQL